jgi:type I restriction enzyme S subunit
MTKDLAPYPAYKPSGIPWLGNVPGHWQFRRVSRLFRMMDRPVRKGPTHIPNRPVGAGLKPAPTTCNRTSLTNRHLGLMNTMIPTSSTTGYRP